MPHLTLIAIVAAAAAVAGYVPAARPGAVPLQRVSALSAKSQRSGYGAAATVPAGTGSRREYGKLMGGLLAVGLVEFAPFVHPMPARAAEAGKQRYLDEQSKVSFDVPGSWVRKDSEIAGGRTLVLFQDEKEPSTNAYVAYTPVRADFSALGSFGTVDEFAGTVVPRGEGIKSTLLSAKSAGGAYAFDYTIETPQQPLTHLRSTFALIAAPNGGAGNVLLALTAQCLESEYGVGDKSAALDAVMKSFSFESKK